ncbi:unnamed protein product [Protopolystoma xenopodis]|uniref:FERM domain-containing protein n=1 Tax=Protopolystoma xenopodis TaxID=117903 RepID=A0A3S5C3D1_9PLAT|nr:unnamed protein product [Protopolystoma xenopodis]
MASQAPQSDETTVPHRGWSLARPSSDNSQVLAGSKNLVISYVTLANSRVFHVEVDQKADGQEVLEKICKLLGIMDEVDYFGLQYFGPKNELLWVNTRNRLSKQIPGGQPYKLYFRVKFYVPPHTLLLEETRHQFFINIVQQLKQGLWDTDTSLELQAHLIALMAHAQFGDYNPVTTPCKYACFWPDRRDEIPPEAVRMAASFHRDLEGTTKAHSQYEVLRLVYMDMTSYGTHFYEAKDIFDHKILIGVGPEGICLCSTTGQVIERVTTVTTSTRVVTLNLLEDDASLKSKNYQLATTRLGNSLYRCIMELHSFFRCDSVREDVITQTNRDLRDAFTSLFDHNGE